MNLLSTKLKYNTKQKILVAIDCIIFGFDGENLKILLFKRKVEPFKGAWSLVGAFINDKVPIDEGAKQILFEFTGLDHIFLEELKTYGAIDRDPVERVISIAHYSLMRINDFELKRIEQFDAKWFNYNDLPELILDHGKMVEDAMARLKSKIKYHPVGLNLLPTYFSIPQLMRLYESIYQKKIDPGNFRKKILASNILIKTNKKDKSGSKKGAFLYKFNTKAITF